MKDLHHLQPVCHLTGNEFLPKEGITFAEQVLNYYISQGGIASSPWGDVLLFICVVVVIFNLKERRLYLHETFLTEKIPEIAASSLVRGSDTASPQSKGIVAKLMSIFFSSK